MSQSKSVDDENSEDQNIDPSDVQGNILPDQPEDSSNMASSMSQPSTETETMEIHKHPHHVMHKKKWTEYILEFFMIFFAVTLGFFAETTRERITEDRSAAVFALSMVNDLKTDTTQLSDYIRYMDYASKNVDTLFQMLAKTEPKKIESGKLYWYGLWGGAHRDFVPDDATFQQMKSSGSLRFFRNHNIITEVTQYDQLCRKWEAVEEMNRDIYTEVRKSRAQIFEFKFNSVANDIYQEHKNAPDQRAIDSFIHRNPPLLSYDHTVFNQYVELVRSRFLHSNVVYADSLRQQAARIITDLTKEYHLK